MNYDVKTEPHDDETHELDPTKMMNITEQLTNFRELLLYINKNKESEKKNKDEFDKKIIRLFDNKVIRKFINLMLEPTNRGVNAKYAIELMTELKSVQDNKSDVKPVVQKYINKFTDEYMYKPHGGKEAFEKKVNENNEK
jgi:hypothetical protein